MEELLEGTPWLFSILALFITLFVNLSIVRVQLREKRRDVCLKLWELWTSPGVKQSRSRAYKHLQDTKSHIDLSKLEEDQQDLRGDFSVVFHFFKDLYIMVERGDVDKSFAKQLFLDEVVEWFKYISPDSNSEIEIVKIWDDEHQSWGEKFVLPLKSTLENCPDKIPWYRIN